MAKMNINEIKRMNDRIFSRAEYDCAMKDFEKNGSKYTCKRLLTCQAWVYTSDNYFLLKSYNTFIAVIDRNSGCGYDVLRYVDRYTSTSAQHISKFFNDYNAIKVCRYYPN